MTNKEIWQIALRQSACDCNCTPADFFREEAVMTLSRPHPEARKYLPLPFACDLVSYGSNVVAQTSPDLAAPVGDFLGRFQGNFYRCFETPNLYLLNDFLQPWGYQVCFMAEYFLPDVERLAAQPCPYPLRLLHPVDFAALYRPEWSHALCEERKELDVLGVGAYDGDTLIGFAACSADCAEMYQIGVDVLPAYRRQGVASALTSRLALEILALGKVPFYCAAWSNVRSVRNAIRSGFRPAWVELTARDRDFVNRMNGHAK